MRCWPPSPCVSGSRLSSSWRPSRAATQRRSGAAGAPLAQVRSGVQPPPQTSVTGSATCQQPPPTRAGQDAHRLPEVPGGRGGFPAQLPAGGPAEEQPQARPWPLSGATACSESARSLHLPRCWAWPGLLQSRPTPAASWKRACPSGHLPPTMETEEESHGLSGHPRATLATWTSLQHAASEHAGHCCRECPGPLRGWSHRRRPKSRGGGTCQLLGVSTALSPSRAPQIDQEGLGSWGWSVSFPQAPG